MTNIITSFSSKRTHEEAVTEIEAQLSLIKPNLVIFFASSFYKPDSLALRMQQAFPSATTLGCTTSGEICNNNILAQSVVAIGFTKEAIGDYHVRITLVLSLISTSLVAQQGMTKNSSKPIYFTMVRLT
jgi:hypothetical protein